MPQHFLHRASTRDFSIFDVTDLTPTTAHEFLADARWGSSSTPTCPDCGTVDRHYFRSSRFQWRCKHCAAYFSVTTGTVFQDRKVPLRTLIAAVFLYSTAANGISSLELSRSLRISVKSAFVLLSKLREVLVRQANLTPLSGSVQMDGAHFCAKPRKPNKRRKITGVEVMERLSAKKGLRSPAKSPGFIPTKASKDRLKNRRVVLVAREVSIVRGEGALRTVVGVAMHENEPAVLGFGKMVIQSGSTLWTDENAAYNRLGALHSHSVVNHSVEFVTDDGVHDNQAESFHSRMRRAEYGVLHGFRPKYLNDYLWEFAWRDDFRRKPSLERLKLLLKLALATGRSLWWRGYWQRHHRRTELLFKLGYREDFVQPTSPGALLPAPPRTSFPH